MDLCIGERVTVTLSGVVKAVGAPYLGSERTEVILRLDSSTDQNEYTLRLDAALLGGGIDA